MQENRPKVGVGILIFNGDKILLGKRISKLGKHTYSPPGGHLEFGETPEFCAGRELLEETGLNIEPSMFTFAGLTNDVFEEKSAHYISIFMKADYPKDQIVKNCEPDKNAGWDWYPLSDLPTPLFSSFKNWSEDKTYGAMKPAFA